jgi:hypothetical protein
VRYGEPVDQEYRDLRTMTGSPLRRLQELAAVLGGGLVRVSERRRRRIARAACQSAVEPLDP